MYNLCWAIFLLFYFYTQTLAQCSGIATLSASSGTFSDGSGTSNYQNNLNCAWLIQPQGAEYVQLIIESFSTESGHDYLTIYDGTNTSGAILSGPFSGSISNVPAIYSTSPSMYVVFMTDSSNTAAGWTMNYAAEQGPAPTCSGT